MQFFFLKFSMVSEQNSRQVRRSRIYIDSNVYVKMLIGRAYMDSFCTKILIDWYDLWEHNHDCMSKVAELHLFCVSVRLDRQKSELGNLLWRWSKTGFWFKSQVINREGNIADFGKQAAHPHPIFLGVPSPPPPLGHLELLWYDKYNAFAFKWINNSFEYRQIPKYIYSTTIFRKATAPR